MLIRIEEEQDWPAVHALNCAAFDSRAEADLVDALRRKSEPFMSLVAVCDESVVGHIAFSPVTLSGHADIRLMGLGPMAVLPALQRTGIGSALIDAGLDRCCATAPEGLEAAAVVVLGHPKYYKRFGFQPSVVFDIRSEYDVPDEVFMIAELRVGALKQVSGIVVYNDAFSHL